jgi:hypothetical protein
MSVIILPKGSGYVYGMVDKSKPLLKIPSEAIGWKVRCRKGAFAYIFIRYNDGIEKRALLFVEDHYEVANWVQEANIRP